MNASAPTQEQGMTGTSGQTKRTKDLIAVVAQQTGIDPKVADQVVRATLHEIRGGLTVGSRWQLDGFGTFDMRQHNERSGVNPQTKEPLTIPARQVVGFKPASGWNDTYNTQGGIGQIDADNGHTNSFAPGELKENSVGQT